MLVLVEIWNSYTLVLYYEIRSKGGMTEYCKINSRILPESELGTEGCPLLSLTSKSETKCKPAEYCLELRVKAPRRSWKVIVRIKVQLRK